MAVQELGYFRSKENPHGMRCVRCGYLFMREGEPYFGIPVASDVVKIVCPPCAGRSKQKRYASYRIREAITMLRFRLAELVKP